MQKILYFLLFPLFFALFVYFLADAVVGKGKKIPALCGGYFSKRSLVLQLLHANIAVLDTLAVSQEADMALLVEQTWVVAAINSVGVLVATIGSNIVALASLADVAIDDNFTIYDNGDVITLSADFLAVPLAQSAPLDTLCGDDAIY